MGDDPPVWLGAMLGGGGMQGKGASLEQLVVSKIRVWSVRMTVSPKTEETDICGKECGTTSLE